MFKRRRGVVLKCAALMAAFWFGFAIYVNSVARSADDSRVEPKERQSAHGDRGAEAEQRRVTPPIDWLPGRDDDRAKRDRELQERFRRDQEKLQELLRDGRRTPAAVSTAAADLRKYDPQTASLIRLGLIIPKWNISEERPEHLGAPGDVNLFSGDGYIAVDVTQMHTLVLLLSTTTLCQRKMTWQFSLWIMYPDVYGCSKVLQWSYSRLNTPPSTGSRKCNPVPKHLCPHLRASPAFTRIGNVTVWHSSSGCQPNFAAFSRRRNLRQGSHHVEHQTTF